jgi:hypothetical protein
MNSDKSGSKGSSLSFRLVRNLSEAKKDSRQAGIDMSNGSQRSMKMTPSPLSPPLKGGEIILSPRPLGERVRVRGTFGSMTRKADAGD